MPRNKRSGIAGDICKPHYNKGGISVGEREGGRGGGEREREKKRDNSKMLENWRKHNCKAPNTFSKMLDVLYDQRYS